jgi:tetratricopeptide (TPR) repeat protein
MQREPSGAAAILILLLFMPTMAMAQGPVNGPIASGARQGSVKGSGAQLIIRVREMNGSPLGRPASIKLTSDTATLPLYGTTLDGGQVKFDLLTPGRYTIEVNASGYRTTQAKIEIVARGMQEVMVSVAPETTGGASTPPMGPPILAPKARKETERGLAALKAGNLQEAQRHIEAAHKLAPGNPDVNYLLGLLYLDLRDMGQAQTYLEKATSIDPKHVPGLTALGELRLRQEDYAGALDPLEKAVSLAPQQWAAHYLLAVTCLNRGEFDEARKEAEQATHWSEGTAKGAEFVLGAALGALGRRAEAVSALEAFLRDSPEHPASKTARQLIEKLQNSSNPLRGETFVRTTSLSSGASMLAAPDARLSLPHWAPPSVDQVIPPVAEGTVCPLEQVMEGASRRVKEFAADVDRFAATEEVLHEKLDEQGRSLATDRRKFDYLVSIAEVHPGILSVEEFRNKTFSPDQFPAGIATLGLPALMLIFHPANREDFRIACEGRGEWRGQAAWQVYFRQRDDRPSRVRSYRINGKVYPVSLKGRAWIAADTYQILRLEAESVRAIPEITLLSEHEVVEYGPVRFRQRNVELWLPTTADLYFEFHHQRYHRQHSFHDYMLFWVDERQIIGTPNTANQN